MRDKGLDLGFNIENAGYRLSKFQLFNWGTFDNNIVNLDLYGKNTLLTGGNGSGKTTLVDALLTLLVPTNDRTYNLSSGNDGKNGRTEESYVLGTYSTSKEVNEYTTSRKTLRDKNCHNIILAIFSNKTAANSITLMQFRYFSSNGALKRQYFIIEGELTIDDLNEKKVGYNPATNWIQDIKKTFSDLEITSYDTFKRYSHDFAKIFGFRYKDKAIKIFSQTVGMKDLHDLNSFIREKILDENDSFDIFNNISKNYNNLTILKNQIDKEELQIEMLEKINEAYSSYQYFYTKKEKKETIKEKYLKIWEAQTSLNILNEELKELSSSLEEQEIKLKTIKEEKNIAQDNIKEMHQTLFSDQRNSRIEELNTRRKDLINTISHLQNQVDLYQKHLDNIGFDFPEDETLFTKIIHEASSKIEIIDHKILSLEEDKNELISQKNIINNQIENISSQLSAIEDKQSNIPISYLKIRDQICEATSINIDELNFLGELIRVKESSLDKSKPINALIRSIATALLVLPQHAKKVVDYLDNNQLKNEMRLIIIEDVIENTLINGEDKDQLSIFEDTDEIIFEEDSIPILSNLMLEIKDDYQHKAFLTKYLSNYFSYSYTQNKEIIFNTNKTFNENGLLNFNNQFIKPITNEEYDINIIGWDTKEKISRLNTKKQELISQIKTFETDIKHQDSLIRKEKKKMDSLIFISEFSDYSSINTKQYKAQIENIDKQLLELKNSSSDLENIREKLKDLEIKSEEYDYNIDSLNQQIGGLKSAITSKSGYKKQIESILFNQDLTTYFEPIAKMQTEYNIPNKFIDTKEVKYYKDQVEATLNKEIKDIEVQYNKTEKELITKINQFINPKASIISDYPSWTRDTNNLSNDIDAIDLFKLMLDKLKTDSLPKYKEQFSTLRTRQIQQDIIDLNSSLKEWNRKIKENIEDLNESLNSLIYQKTPETKIRLSIETNRDKEVRKFKNILNNALPDPNFNTLSNEEKEKANEKFIVAVDDLVKGLKENERFAQKVLDVRNWYQFGVEEYYCENLEQARYYKDSAAISGGQKAKLAYTILAAAIAHQFDVFNFDNNSRSFRFVIVDEAFSKSDDENSKYAMNLFNAMDLQLMVVTPMDKVNLVEPFIDTVQITVCNDGKHSFVRCIKKEELKALK